MLIKHHNMPLLRSLNIFSAGCYKDTAPTALVLCRVAAESQEIAGGQRVRNSTEARWPDLFAVPRTPDGIKARRAEIFAEPRTYNGIQLRRSGIFIAPTPLYDDKVRRTGLFVETEPAQTLAP
jgi:hypothetical protein